MTRDLLAPEPTKLPADHVDVSVLAQLADGADADALARQHPDAPAVWAHLARAALGEGQHVQAYAYARTGYHRGLDALRRNGWRGAGPVPWSHEANRGVLQAISALGAAAAAIEEDVEARRLAELLVECDPQLPPSLNA